MTTSLTLCFESWWCGCRGGEVWNLQWDSGNFWCNIQQTNSSGYPCGSVFHSFLWCTPKLYYIKVFPGILIRAGREKIKQKLEMEVFLPKYLCITRSLKPKLTNIGMLTETESLMQWYRDSIGRRGHQQQLSNHRHESLMIWESHNLHWNSHKDRDNTQSLSQLHRAHSSSS